MLGVLQESILLRNFQNVRPDLYPNCLTLWLCSCIFFLENANFDDKKKHEIFPSMQSKFVKLVFPRAIIFGPHYENICLLVYDQVRCNPAYSATETSKILKFGMFSYYFQES